MKHPGSSSEHWDRALTLTLVLCSLVVTGLVVYRALVLPEAQSEMGSRQPTFVEGWESQLQGGGWLGPSAARVKIIEFGDFECPFCATLHTTLKELRRRYPAEVAIYYVHYPIPGHRFADAAARAAECSGQQGQFERMHDVLFERQREIGISSWNEFAADAGVPDLATFAACIESHRAAQRIAEGIEFGEQLKIKGTPTLLINGWQLNHSPSSNELDRMVKAVIQGRSPISTDQEIERTRT